MHILQIEKDKDMHMLHIYIYTYIYIYIYIYILYIQREKEREKERQAGKKKDQTDGKIREGKTDSRLCEHLFRKMLNIIIMQSLYLSNK